MEWQLIVVGLLIALAAAYIGWQTWRAWRPGKRSCGGGCGCPKPAKTDLVPLEQLTLRKRDD